MGTLVGAPLSTRDTVLWDTAAAAAMSRIVAGVDPGSCRRGDIPARLA